MHGENLKFLKMY